MRARLRLGCNASSRNGIGRCGQGLGVVATIEAMGFTRVNRYPWGQVWETRARLSHSCNESCRSVCLTEGVSLRHLSSER